MRKILLPCFIMLCMFTAHAQKSPAPSKLVLSINGGTASPSGNYSKAAYADEKSGFAKTGFHLNVSGVYHLSKTFGIGALVGYSQFGHKGSLSLADGYKEDSGTDSTTLYTKGSNSTLSVLVGPYYSIPISHRVSIDLRVLGGYVHNNLSGFQVFYEDYTDNAMSQNKSSASAFGWQAGAGLSYAVTGKVFIKANADYFSSKPKMDISYENFIVNSGRKLDTYNEAVSGIAATVGIGFKIF